MKGCLSCLARRPACVVGEARSCPLRTSDLGSVVTEHAAVGRQVRDEEVHAHRGSGCPSPRARDKMIVVDANNSFPWRSSKSMGAWACTGTKCSRHAARRSRQCRREWSATACKGSVIAMLKSWPMKLTPRRIMCAWRDAWPPRCASGPNSK